MANISFHEPQYGSKPSSGPKRSWLTNLVIKAGLAKDDAGAQKVLIIILIVVVIAIVVVNVYA